MADQDTIFCGSGKERKFDNGGSIIKCVLDMDVLNEASREYGFKTDRGKNKGALKLKVEVCTRRQVDEYGNSHFVKVDTWVPDSGFNKQSTKEEYDDEL